MEYIYVCKNINSSLASERGLPESRVRALDTLTGRLLEVINRPFSYFGDHKSVVSYIESCENVLQDLWGFDVDRSKHSYWNKVQGCVCPRMDNQDNWGVDHRIHDMTCPFHKQIIEEVQHE